jgi:hypothetical protein
MGINVDKYGFVLNTVPLIITNDRRMRKVEETEVFLPDEMLAA